MAGEKPATNWELSLACAIFCAALGWFIYTWILTDAGWLQVELLAVPDALFANGNADGLGSQLSNILNWHLFDFVSLRLRVVSDVVEVIDTVFRPRLAWLTGLRPSVSVTSIPMALATVGAVFLAVRRIGLSRPLALLLTALFVSTVGFQSCFIAYIRPAKRIALLAFCLGIWLVLRAVQEKRERDLVWALAVMEVASLADEMGLLLFVAAIVYVGWAVARGGMSPRALGIVALFPLLHLVVAYGVLPYVYILGPDGVRPHTFSGPEATNIMGHVLDPVLYRLAFSNLTSEVLVTLGAINWPQAVTVAVVGGLCLIWLRPRLTSMIGCATIVLAACVLFTSLIDFFATPPSSRSFADFFKIVLGYYPHVYFTYYYHSIVAPAVLFVVAATVASATRKIPAGVIAAAASAVIVSNFVNFAYLNDLWQRIHIYPIEPTAVVSLRDELHKDPGVTIDLEVAPSAIASPMGTEDYVRRLVRAFYPQRDVSLTRVHERGSAPAKPPVFPYLW